MHQWYGRDTSLSVRMFVVMFLLAALYLAFMVILWKAGVGLIIIAVVAVVLGLFQYWAADKLAIASIGARQVSEQEEPALHGMVERLAQMANLPKPALYIADTSVPNAFATGRGPKHASIVVTSAIMNMLTEPELEAVLAHEMSHVVNRDMAVMTFASLFAMVASFIMQMALWGGIGYGGRRSRDNNVVIAYFGAMVVWAISFVLIRALSRYRELAADRGSALVTGAPANLASALMKVTNTMQSGRIPDDDLRHAETLNALCMVPAIGKESLMEMFSTHPSLEHRLAQLEQMQREMGQI